MFNKSKTPSTQNKQTTSLAKSNRIHPRPKGLTKLSPCSKTSVYQGDRLKTIKNKISSKNIDNNHAEKNNLQIVHERISKRNFQKEMKVFVKNKEFEKNKACLQSKMSFIYSLFQCLSPFKNKETIDYDFIINFLAVGTINTLFIINIK